MSRPPIIVAPEQTTGTDEHRPNDQGVTSISVEGDDLIVEGFFDQWAGWSTRTTLTDEQWDQLIAARVKR